jgi:ribonuclease HI
LDYGEELKYWPHPADAVTIKEVAGNEEASVQANTDGSRHDKGVGSGAAIFVGSEMVVQLKKKLDNICSNNQAEEVTILKALEAIDSLKRNRINPRTATIFSDIRVSLDLLHNPITHILSKRLDRS